ncbi:MAG: hypothetical protein ACTH1D_06280 [Mycobacteriaceae bacterium]|uniref:hypothetical protein n=1 Tax=Corynebacterium sp. TaxID=1720 RepID=UPI003F94AC96
MAQTQQVHATYQGAAGTPVDAAEVVDLLDAAGDSAVDCIRRSTVFRRMSDGTLPFAGRAAYLEQHWEGLRVLRNALAAPGMASASSAGALAPLRTALAAATEQFAGALDKAHATARWRDRHVTMPSMLQFRRHIVALQDEGDVLGLVGQTYLRLLAAGACPTPAADMGEDRAVHEAITALVSDEEGLELLSEELSAALLILMQHGSDVCRGYQERDADSSCAVTAATIRSALQ